MKGAECVISLSFQVFDKRQDYSGKIAHDLMHHCKLCTL